MPSDYLGLNIPFSRVTNRATYHRGEYMPERINLMKWWADLQWLENGRDHSTLIISENSYL
jgi:hypothetical protein